MFIMRKLSTRTLTGDGTTCQFEAGTFQVAPFATATAMRLKIRCQLTKSGGDAALTAAQRRTFLASFDASLSYGAGQQHKPFNKLDWNKLRNLTRYGLGSEIEGFTDTSTGLARTIASTATDVTFFLRIPFTALGWQDPQVTTYWGVGPTQASTMVLDLRRGTVSLPTNFAITGNVTIEQIPDEVPASADMWTYIPEYSEFSETDRFFRKAPNGLCALMFERTAVHASTALTDVGLKLRDFQAYDKVTLAEVITRYRDPQAYFPSEADVSDEYTLLWAVPPGIRLDDLPAGKPEFVQYTQSLSTLLVSTWTYPHVPEAAIEADVLEMARRRGRHVNVVSGYQAGGKALKKTLQFCAPLYIYELGEKEFTRYAGLSAVPGAVSPVVFIPETLAETAKARAATRERSREYAGAEDDVQQVALSVPGAGSPEGLAHGSRILDKVRAAIAA